MEKALIALNQIVAEGVISDYAIGGAVGAAFYIEAMQTQDVDAFVFMKPEPNGLLSLSPIYAALVAKGGVVKDEHIVIDGWPIQVLPAYKPLVEKFDLKDILIRKVSNWPGVHDEHPPK